MGPSTGSSADLNAIFELLASSICCMIIPAILSSVALIWGAHMAQKKGRSAGAWTALILFFGIIPFIVLCCLPDLTDKQAPKPGYASIPVPSTTSGHIVLCPSCQRRMRVGAEYIDSKVRCPSCKGVIDVRASLEGTKAPTPPFSQNQGTWTCECGVRNPLFRMSCSACGTRNPAAPKKCPYCGETVTSSTCGMCGRRNSLFGE